MYVYKTLFFFFKCCTLCFNLQAVRLIKWEWFCFKISWIGFFTTSLQPQGVVGTHCFHTQSILFYKCPPAVHTPTSGCRGKEKKMFFILQRANQNIPYYVCDASNPWCGLEFCSSPKTAGWHSQYIQSTSRLIKKALSSSPLLSFFVSLSHPHSLLCFSNVCAVEDKSKALFY